MNTQKDPNWCPLCHAGEDDRVCVSCERRMEAAIRAAVRGVEAERNEKADQQIGNLQARLHQADRILDEAGISRTSDVTTRILPLPERMAFLRVREKEATARAEKAEARVRELEGVLRPMAEEARMWAGDAPGDRPLFHRHTTPSAISLDDCRRASAALTPEAPDA